MLRAQLRPRARARPDNDFIAAPVSTPAEMTPNGTLACLDTAASHTVGTFDWALPPRGCVPFEVRLRRRTAASSAQSCGPVLFRGKAARRYPHQDTAARHGHVRYIRGAAVCRLMFSYAGLHLC